MRCKSTCFIKQKIIEMLDNVDLEHLVVETKSTINHINRIRNKSESGRYFWYNEIDNIHRPYYMAESLANEICAWIESRKEPVKRIAALLVCQFDDLPK